MNRLGILLLFSCFFLSVDAVPLDQMPAPQGYVTDLDGALDDSQRAGLESQLSAIEDASTVEIAMVLIDSTDGMPIAQFATNLGNRWRVGKRDTFNGIVVLVAVDDREYFIATAKGIEGTIPDLVAYRIGETDFPPYFRENDYYTGLSLAADDLNGYIANDPTIVSQYQSGFDSSDSSEAFDSIGGNAFILLLLAFFLPSVCGALAQKAGLPFWSGTMAFGIAALGLLLLIDVLMLAIFGIFIVLLCVMVQ
jgi:uncharacterized protein